MNDWLDAASVALKKTQNGEPRAAAEQTRAEVWKRARQVKPRTFWKVLILPGIVGAFGSVAYAEELEHAANWVAMHVQLLPAFKSANAEREAAMPKPAPTATSVAAKRHASAPPQAATPWKVADALDAQTASSVTKASTGSAPHSAHSLSPHPAPSSPPAKSEVSKERTEPLELYKAAHRLHFGGTDMAAALGAWDAYLNAAPHGPFALEARYNRGVCLARLGRRQQARAALLPFSQGQYGKYKQAEATRLLETLHGP